MKGLGCLQTLAVLCNKDVATSFSLSSRPSISHSLTLESVRSASDVDSISTQIKRISVCIGELCQCQGDEYAYNGGAADAAFETLESLDLPYPIQKVGCIGACGMGTMIFIDYENGQSTLTNGLSQVMNELGLRLDVKNKSINEGLLYEREINENRDESEDLRSQNCSQTITEYPSADQLSQFSVFSDVRERMRYEAVRDDQGNPWVNMVYYLATKARESVMGRE